MQVSSERLNMDELNIYDKYLFALCDCSVDEAKTNDIKFKHLTYDIVKSLVRAGANVNTRTSGGRTPLIRAIKNNNPVMVETLLCFGANPNQEGKHKSHLTVIGKRPLHYAAEFNQEDIVKLLLQYGADVNAKTSENDTPLHYACLLSKSNEVIKLLINHGADVNLYNETGISPIFNAIFFGNKEAVSILLDNNVDINGVNTINDLTPLIVAVKKRDPDMVNFLIDKGADVNLRVKKHEHLNGPTPLHVACKKLLFLEPEFNEYDEVIKTLVKRGAEINAVDFNGNTPLNLMKLEDNYIDMVGYMLLNGANPAIENNSGISPLHKTSNKLKCQNTMKLMKKYSKPKTTIRGIMNETNVGEKINNLNQEGK